MARRILVIADAADQLSMADYLIRQDGDIATTATISVEKASETSPYIGDLLRQCKEGGSSFDAVLIFDLSKPKDYVTPLHKTWVEINEKLRSLDRDMEAERIHFSYTTQDDASAVSNRAEDLQRSMDKLHADMVQERRALLQRSKDAAENMMLMNPPSEKGPRLIHRLRAEDSPLKDAPIAIFGAHPDREKELLAAGADVVHTSADSIRVTPGEVMEDAYASHREYIHRMEPGHEPSFRARAIYDRLFSHADNKIRD